jgi:ribose-phosphate pyrophosphokinase
MKDTVIFCGSSNFPLGKSVVKNLGTRFGSLDIEFFPNGESRIRVLESVKDKEVIILQSTNDPTNKYIIELCLVTDAAKRMGAKKVTAIIPWFGYSPQDKVFREGEPLSSEVVVRILESSGIDEFVLMDVHSPLVLEFFSKKVTNLTVIDLFADYMKDTFSVNPKHWCVASLDKGGYERAVEFSTKLGIGLVQFHKTRDRSTGDVTFNRLEGEVKDKKIISFDDFVSTGSTLIQSADILKQMGASEYFCCATHVVVNETIERIQKSSIDKFITTNSVNIPVLKDYSKANVIDISPFIADYIRKNFE